MTTYYLYTLAADGKLHAVRGKQDVHATMPNEELADRACEALSDLLGDIAVTYRTEADLDGTSAGLDPDTLQHLISTKAALVADYYDKSPQQRH